MQTSETTKTKRNRIVILAEISILAAITLLMAFTPIGFLRVGLIEISFLAIPVVIGAIVLGPAAGAILGSIFGLASFIQCLGMSPFGVVLFQINPFYTFLITFFPRLLMGLLTALIFKAFRKKSTLSYVIPSISGALLNTVLFTSTLFLLFQNAEIIQNIQGEGNIFTFFVAFVGINGVVEAIACGIIGTIISRLLYRMNQKQFQLLQ